MDWIGGKTRGAKLWRILGVALLWAWILIFELVISTPGICQQPLTYCIEPTNARIAFSIFIQIIGVIGAFVIVRYGVDKKEKTDSTSPAVSASS